MTDIWHEMQSSWPEISAILIPALVVSLGAIGTFLLLPHRHIAARPRIALGAGAVAAGLGLLGFVAYWSPPGPLLPRIFLYIFGLTSVVGAVLTITSRDPVASALWFASVVLSTSGLFLLADAPFLAAGTIIVYAGAVVVTFLFVIMLAQMEGKAPYDRAARSPAMATVISFLVLWCLLYSVATVRTGPVSEDNTPRGRVAHENALHRSYDLGTFLGDSDRPVLEQSLTTTSQISEPPPPPDPAAPFDRPSGRAEKPNVAGLGASLYSDHLVTAGIAGALLFVALIGCVAITNPRRPIRPGNDPAQVAAVGSSRP
ncbi:MAG: NADH-quinone oxidoreductase subunit J family protein [Isosphaeraceae bacterium]